MLKALDGWFRKATPGAWKAALALLTVAMSLQGPALASEADIRIPKEFYAHSFEGLGGIQGTLLLYVGIGVCLLGVGFALLQARQIQALPAHRNMLEISELIFATCRAYLLQQGKFLTANHEGGNRAFQIQHTFEIAEGNNTHLHLTGRYDTVQVGNIFHVIEVVVHCQIHIAAVVSVTDADAGKQMGGI